MQPSETGMVEDAMASAVARLSERVEQQRRLIYSQSERTNIPDCAEPTIVPEQILWCPNNDGPAKQWLLSEELPWWFFASFVNYCVHTINNYARRPRNGRCYPAERRLLACLSKFPSNDDELIEEFKWYLTGPALSGCFKKFPVDFETLSMLKHLFG